MVLQAGLVSAMRIKITPCDAESIRRVGEVVRKGGVIIFPTDTVYGIGGDPFNAAVVRRIFEMKMREEKPMPVLVSGLEDARRLVDVDRLTLALMERFWPGALTVVSRVKEGLPLQLTANSGKLGVRMPQHELALKIIEASGGALIGTSANVSGAQPAKTVGELDPRLVRGADVIVEGGDSTLGVSSTVVEVTLKRAGPEVRILREGAIRTEVIRESLLKAGMRGVRLA
jgi:L-threonylcarbamoyladenylate synthase